MSMKDYVLLHAAGNLYWKDRNGRYLGCNLTFSKLAGLDNPDDIIGKSDQDLFSDYLSHEEIQKLVDVDRYVVNNNQEKTLEETGIDAQGNEAIFLTKKIPLKNDKGETIGLIGNSINISKQKEAEYQLLKEKKKVEQSDQLKTAFIQNMEHDIRTPISGVFGLIDILSKDDSGSCNKEILSMLSDASKELLEYCNGLLDFTKLEAGPQPVTEKPINIHQLMKSIFALEMPAAKQKNIELNYFISNELPEVILSDEFRIKRILLNLIGNALKFTQVGTIEITINPIPPVKNRCFVLEISIKDTGIGIPEDKQNLIYQKYVKVSPSNKGLYKGTGLGLSMVKQFIGELDGEIQLESQLGIGSTFSLYIPVKQSIAGGLGNNH